MQGLTTCIPHKSEHYNIISEELLVGCSNAQILFSLVRAYVDPRGRPARGLTRHTLAHARTREMVFRLGSMYISAHKLLDKHYLCVLATSLRCFFLSLPFSFLFRVRSISWRGSWDHLHIDSRCHGCRHGNNCHSHRLLLLQTTWFLLQHCHTQQEH